MQRPLSDVARMALECQNACNLSGVVHTFSELMSDLWSEAHATGKGTDWVNRHPVVTLMLDKLTQLNGVWISSQANFKVEHAYEEVQRLASSAR